MVLVTPQTRTSLRSDGGVAYRSTVRSDCDDPRKCGLPEYQAEAIATRLVSDPKLLKSMRKYSSGTILHFGEWTDDEGWIHTGGSRNTLAYRAVRELLTSM